MKFYKIFAKVQHPKVASKMAFSYFYHEISSKIHAGGRKKFSAPRGGLVQLFGLPWGFTPNQCGSHEKQFLTRRTLFPVKMKYRKCRFWPNFERQNLIFYIVAEISDRKCCRHFWQHDGDPLTPKCPETRFHEIL